MVSNVPVVSGAASTTASDWSLARPSAFSASVHALPKSGWIWLGCASKKIFFDYGDTSPRICVRTQPDLDFKFNPPPFTDVFHAARLDEEQRGRGGLLQIAFWRGYFTTPRETRAT